MVTLPSDVKSFMPYLGRQSLFRGEIPDYKMIGNLCWGRAIEKGPKSKIVLEYSGSAIYRGRPINGVMIVLVGRSGTGKSTTINQLFDDPSLCESSSSQSETSEVTIYTKKLQIRTKDETLKIGAEISFVDVPGYSDTTLEKEDANFKKILEFRSTSVALKDRKFSSFGSYLGRDKVYPNLVLLTVKASDNRLDGQDSMFRNSLKLLQMQELVDVKLNNLIVVTTHACEMAVNPKIYTSTKRERTELIQKIVAEVFKIDKVPIVFVENKPVSYDLFKKEGSDFYSLPDKELSHANLITEMRNVFRRNGDKLGPLLTAWYFRSNCPEKPVKARVEIFKADEVTAIADETFNREYGGFGGNIFATCVTDRKRRQEYDILSILMSSSLGDAYCPVTEENKCHYLLHRGRSESLVEVEGLILPKWIKIGIGSEMRLRCTTFNTKEDYELNRKIGYGIKDSSLEFIVDNEVNEARGKWTCEVDESFTVSILYERVTRTMQIQDPKKHVSQRFLSTLKDLPEEFNSEEEEAFLKFFKDFGTHMVWTAYFGGFVKFDCYITAEQLKNSSTRRIGLQAAEILKEYFVEGKYKDYQPVMDRLSCIGITWTNISVYGGDPRENLALAGLENFTRQSFKDWYNAVDQKPEELDHRVKLVPYYELMDECHGSKQALKKAIAAYLANILVQSPEPPQTRDEIADNLEQETGSKCFPLDALVMTESGLKTIQDLTAGDHLLTLTSDLSSSSMPKFCKFIHQDYQTPTEFITLTLENGRRLSATGNHMVFILENDKKLFIRMEEIKMGNKLIQYSHEERFGSRPRVVKIEKEVKIGFICPLTMSGTLLVNGFLVSSYADVDNFKVANGSFFPLKVWYGMKDLFTKASIIEEPERKVHAKKLKSSEIHPYAKVLMRIRDVLQINV